LHYLFILLEAGYIFNKTRSLLDPNTANMLVCLRDWCRWHWTAKFHYTQNFI